MHRVSFIVLSSLFLVAALAAKASDAETSVDLDATALKITNLAFRFGDYATVEMLFDKLSPENKKKFLQEATEVATIQYTAGLSEDVDRSTLPFIEAKTAGLLEIAGNLGAVDRIPVLLEQYVEDKTLQTQLLGRLMASLLEQPKIAAKSAVETGAVAPYPPSPMYYGVPR